MLRDVNAIIHAVSVIRVAAVLPEYDIHRLVQQALDNSKIAYRHEAVLGKGKRTDFLVNRTAIEIKQGKHSASLVQRQIAGYLQSDLIDDIVVITRRALRLPAQIGGKQVFILSLDRLWGVSLP